MKLIAALAIGALSCAAPAFAQSSMGGTSETGSLIKRKSAIAVGETPNDLRQFALQFAKCSVSRSRSRAEQLALMPVTADEFDRALDRMFKDDCISSGYLTMNWYVARAALIEALYIDRFGRTGPVDFSAVAPINYMDGYPSQMPDYATSAVSVVQFGDCVSRKDGSNARALVTSVPGSSSETVALQALMPVFGGCVSRGKTMKLSRSFVRGAVSEGLFRLSRQVSATQ